MPNKWDESPTEDSGESITEMMQHLDEAKQRRKTNTRRRPRNKPGTGIQAKIQRQSNVAVLASNHEARLAEITANDAVTHRSGKPWKSARLGVEAHGRLPIYYRQNGIITHKGYISRIILYPDKYTTEAEEFIQHISQDDTYSEYHDLLDTTTFIVTDGEQLDEPFPQTELKKLSGDGNINEGYSRQPAYVIQRPGDFPDFP